MNTYLKLFMLALVFTVQEASAYTGMTADELRTEIARLNRVADTIRMQLAQLGGSADGVGVVTPASPATPVVQTPTMPTYTAPTVPVVGASTCLPVTTHMSPGDSGSNVQRLQEFLMKAGVYTAGVTGYYGPATQAGVQAWQAKYGVVSSGTPATTGYGRVGPGTLARMKASCGGTSVVTPVKLEIEKYSLSLNTTGGKAPLTVTASIVINGSTCTSYALDWGDGSTPIAYDSNKSSACDNLPISLQPKHAYTKRGDYTLRIRTVKGPLRSAEEVGQIVVTVN